MSEVKMFSVIKDNQAGVYGPREIALEIQSWQPKFGWKVSEDALKAAAELAEMEPYDSKFYWEIFDEMTQEPVIVLGEEFLIASNESGDYLLEGRVPESKVAEFAKQGFMVDDNSTCEEDEL